MKHKVETTYGVFELKGELIVGDWEGDPNVPRGLNYFAPYIDEFVVMVNGEEVNLDLFTEKTIASFREALEIAGMRELEGA